MKKLLMIVALIGVALWYKNGGLTSNNAGAFSASNTPEIWLFTFNQCGKPCNDAVSDLENRAAEYTHYKLDDGEEVQSLWSEMGGKTLPFYAIGNQTSNGFFRSDIASKLAQSFGDEYLTRQEKQYMENHFYSDGQAKVYIYGASWCPYCKKLRETLEAKNIDYYELDVEKASDRKAIIETMQIAGYPTVYVGYKRIQGKLDRIMDQIVENI
ncbi:glutaredoxin-like protein [Oleiphilus messinensis]|uniref:Glutaredoxin-like protein n=1 Tax=Oleiphilus messinensis TaxID=141451 RepID=A0A1Y0I3I5_9GAMM|nr:glutaredoxin domain-containing protein [Oleiphilus messinensis]ARU54356.1 glutaredoxin-like protein [Oleiphilus messinensis]